MSDGFFIGWRDAAPGGRRAFLAAALGLAAGAAGAGALLAMNRPAPGSGAWDQSDVRDWDGVLQRAPFPALRWMSEDGAPQTAFLATNGKSAAVLPGSVSGRVRVRASLIARGRAKMLAIDPVSAWIEPASGAPPDATFWRERDLGPALMAGEILDAKCWFGAMRPGYGKGHKACAALCIEGGLPLAFCQAGACGDAIDAPLFLDADGRPHGVAIAALAADPVAARGRLVAVGDVTQFRVDRGAIARL
jgi:hypothetical protein